MRFVLNYTKIWLFCSLLLSWSGQTIANGGGAGAAQGATATANEGAQESSEAVTEATENGGGISIDKVDCKLVQTTYKSLENYSSAFKDKIKQEFSRIGDKRTVSVRPVNRAFFKIKCKANEDLSGKRIKFKVDLDDSFTTLSICSEHDSSTTACVEEAVAMNNSDSTGVELATDKYKTVYLFALTNHHDDRDINLLTSDWNVKVLIQTADDTETRTFRGSVDHVKTILPEHAVAIKGLKTGAETPYCEIALSGLEGDALAGSCSSATCEKVVRVGSDIVNAKVLLRGMNLWHATPESISWKVGGATLPDHDSVISIEPTESVKLIVATVKTTLGNTVQCSAKIQRDKYDGIKVGLNKAGNCLTFTKLRDYYLMKGDQNKLMTDQAGEIPFSGIVNMAVWPNGELIWENGKIKLPPKLNRKYKEVVLLGKIFNPRKEKKKSNVILRGSIDVNNPSVVKLRPQVDLDSLPLRSFVVFQAYLAKEEGSTNYDKNKDKLVPFAYGSCGGLFNFSAPKKDKKPLPSELKDMNFCLVSKPFKLADVVAGRVRGLSVLYLVPPTPLATYPSNLLKTKLDPDTCDKDSLTGETDWCWNISRSDMPEVNVEKVYTEHSDCQYKGYYWYNARDPWKDRYGNVHGSWDCNQCNESNGEAKNNFVCLGDRESVCSLKEGLFFKNNCHVEERPNECTSVLAMRFAARTQMMFAALGCAYTLDRPNEFVTATLVNSGIIPYTDSTTTDLGRANPSNKYDDSLFKYVNEGETITYPNKSVQCVPCRFAQVGDDNLMKTTANMPFNLGDPAGAPIFKFTKSKLSKSCIKRTRIEVRYFGSSACDGMNNPPGHFCESGNIPPRSCSAAGITNPNNAMELTIPLCAGSEFGYRNVAASLSPLLIDVLGEGIQISRSFEYAVKFDMKGNGKPIYVDWPANTREVAFLVRPDKHGKVTSIKQLFGDYKAKNGFEALRKYDSNRDGVINKQDKYFSKLRLWFDVNRDGVCQVDELKHLEDYGVNDISMAYVKAVGDDISGKGFVSSYFNEEDESFKNIKDVYFYVYEKE